MERGGLKQCKKKLESKGSGLCYTLAGGKEDGQRKKKTAITWRGEPVIGMDARGL